MAAHQSLLCGRIGAGDALLEVRPGGGIFAQVEQGAPERVMSFQEVRWRGLVLSEPVELFPRLACRWQRPRP
jgi:hypothetical protein